MATVLFFPRPYHDPSYPFTFQYTRENAPSAVHGAAAAAPIYTRPRFPPVENCTTARALAVSRDAGREAAPRAHLVALEFETRTRTPLPQAWSRPPPR